MKSILLVLLTSSVSLAGVRTVGSGGGYAEMQATLINSNLGTWTQACLLPSNPCQLSENEKSQLNLATKATMAVSFQANCTDLPIFLRDHQNYSIESCALYLKDQEVARNFSEIATLVLVARLMNQANLNSDAADVIARKVFDGYSQTEQQLAVILADSTTLVHSLQVTRESNAYNFVSLEGLTKSLDITANVKAALTCEGSSLASWNLNLLNSQELAAEKVLVEIEAQWQCQDGRAFSATTEVTYEVSQSEISPDSVRVRTVQKSSR